MEKKKNIRKMLILYSLGKESGRWSRIVIYTGKLLVTKRESGERKTKVEGR